MAVDPLQGVAFQSMEDHDQKALTEEQQAQLNKTKVDVNSRFTFRGRLELTVSGVD